MENAEGYPDARVNAMDLQESNIFMHQQPVVLIIVNTRCNRVCAYVQKCRLRCGGSDATADATIFSLRAVPVGKYVCVSSEPLSPSCLRKPRTRNILSELIPELPATL